MGGLISAPMACIDSMFKESKNKKVWTKRGYAVKCCRFRDDIRVLCGANMNDEGINKIKEDFQKMYGNSLKVELEGVQYGKGRFLDVSFVNNEGVLVLSDNN